MTSNVFGSPITNETLEAMPEYKGKTITRRNRAYVALNMKNAEDKYKHALDYIKSLKQEWGSGLSTLCLMYNATGDTIKYVCEHDWHGHIAFESGPYPTEIANGQSCGFLHVKKFGIPYGSSAAVVYRGLNYSDVHDDWMAAWNNPYISSNNTVYTEIREEGHYDKQDNWNFIFELLENSRDNNSNNWNECLSNVTIQNDTSPIFEATFTLVGA